MPFNSIHALPTYIHTYSLIIYFPSHHGSLSDKTISVYDHKNLAQMHFKGIQQIAMLNNSFLYASHLFYFIRVFRGYLPALWDPPEYCFPLT